MADIMSLRITPPLPKDLQNISDDDKATFMDSFDIVFCDCDGVTWRTMQQSIPDVGKGVEFFRKANKKVIFVTNNSMRTVQNQIEKFLENDITVEEEDIIHPVQAVKDYLKKIDFNGLMYVISNTPFREYLEKYGYNITHGPNNLIEETFQDLCKNIFDKQPVSAVVLDVDFNLSVAKLIRAHLYLKNPNCILIGGASDTVIPFGSTDIVGPGPFINVIETTTGCKAKILGKPGKELGEMLLHRYNITNPSRVLFIGDSLEADIHFGNKLGFQTILVLSGATSLKDLENISDEYQMPDFFIESLGHFPKI